MPTHNYITCVVHSVDKLGPNTSSEVQTIYFHQVLVSSSIIKQSDPFLTLSPNLQNLPLQYLAIQILGYYNHESYFSPCNKTHNHPSISLYKFRDQKMTRIWKSSIQASIAGRGNFKIFGLQPYKESMIVMVWKPPLIPPSTNTTWRLVKCSLQMWSSKWKKKIIRYNYLKLFLNILKWMNWKKPRAHMKKVKWMKVQRQFQCISCKLISL